MKDRFSILAEGSRRFPFRGGVFARLVFVVALAVSASACTPALVDFLPAHTFRVVNAETGEPIQGAAMLLTWEVCALNGRRPVYAWGAVSDERGEIRIPTRTVFGRYGLLEFECAEAVTFFKAGGWTNSTAARDLGGFRRGPFGYKQAADGALLVPLRRVQARSWGERFGEVPSIGTDGCLKEAAAQIRAEIEKENDEIGGLQ